MEPGRKYIGKTYPTRTGGSNVLIQHFLIVKGIKGKKIRVVSFGEEKPVKNSSNEMSWTENRRVEISLY